MRLERERNEEAVVKEASSAKEEERSEEGKHEEDEKKASTKKTKAKKSTTQKAPPRATSESGAKAEARRGDLIVIPSQRVGSPPREGEVLRIIHGEVSVSYEVRWADGHETLLSPGVGNITIVQPGRRGHAWCKFTESAPTFV